jgi:chemotaxis protein methyltransferase CheR
MMDRGSWPPAGEKPERTPDRQRIDALLGELLRDRLGHVPTSWPQRLYALVEQTARRMGLTSSSWLGSVLTAPDNGARDALIDAATVGHTSFFRHPEQFEELRRHLVAWPARGAGLCRVWCAGCSTGEEPYSIALTAERLGIRLDIWATDINPYAIQYARAGRYAKVSGAGGLPVEGNAWVAPVPIQRMVRFGVASIVEVDPAAGEGPFDLIFCRNVLIYFARESVADILAGLAGRLRPEGMLVLSPADAVLPLPACLSRLPSPGWLRLSGVAHDFVQNVSSLWTTGPASVRSSGAGNPVLPASDASPIDQAARLLGSGQGEASEALLTELLNHEPDNVGAWFLLGEALSLRGELSQARAAFVRASRCTARETSGVDGEALRWAAARRAEALLEE